MGRDFCGFIAEDGPVLVTGAGGFVGRALMKGFRLGPGDYAADFSSEFNAPEGVARIAWKLPGPPPPSLGSVKYVIHLAGLSSVARSHEGAEAAMEVNGKGTGSVAEWIQANSPGARMLLASSAEVYRPSNDMLEETSPLEPRSPYGRSKLFAESILENTDIDWVVSRSFPHFGPGQQENFVLPSFCRRIIMAHRRKEEAITVGNLQAVRDYLYIDEVVRAYGCLLAEGRSRGIYNVCSGSGHSIGTLLGILMELSGSGLQAVTDPDLLRKGDQFCQIGNPLKLMQLGWQNGIPLEKGLELLYRWWEERL